MVVLVNNVVKGTLFNKSRWHNHLDPGVEKRPLTEAEEALIFEAQKHYGNKWANIAKLLKGRTDNVVKNRFYSTLRRQLRKVLRVKESNKLLEPGEITINYVRQIIKDNNVSYDVLDNENVKSYLVWLDQHESTIKDKESSPNYFLHSLFIIFRKDLSETKSNRHEENDIVSSKRNGILTRKRKRAIQDKCEKVVKKVKLGKENEVNERKVVTENLDKKNSQPNTIQGYSSENLPQPSYFSKNVRRPPKLDIDIIENQGIDNWVSSDFASSRSLIAREVVLVSPSMTDNHIPLITPSSAQLLSPLNEYNQLINLGTTPTINGSFFNLYRTGVFSQAETIET